MAGCAHIEQRLVFILLLAPVVRGLPPLLRLRLELPHALEPRVRSICHERDNSGGARGELELQAVPAGTTQRGAGAGYPAAGSRAPARPHPPQEAAAGKAQEAAAARNEGRGSCAWRIRSPLIEALSMYGSPTLMKSTVLNIPLRGGCHDMVVPPAVRFRLCAVRLQQARGA